MSLIDSYGREIDYLRLSVTDQCNFKCRYCKPPISNPSLSVKKNIWSFNDLYTIAASAVKAGITKIRITGGEPLLRKGVVPFCKILSQLNGLKKLCLSTNGALLKDLAEPLLRSGVQGINISLDTLDQTRFQKMTQTHKFNDVLDGISAAEAAGFNPIKLNVVVIKGFNDDEIADIAAITYKKPYHVRFIELMPFENDYSLRFSQHFMPVGKIMEKISKIKQACRIMPHTSNGPARMYQLPNAKGFIGFISPMSHHFCHSCNRIRITSDGKLRTCLCESNEKDLNPLLSKDLSGHKRAELLKTLVYHCKPLKHQMMKPFVIPMQLKRGMYAIGG